MATRDNYYLKVKFSFATYVVYLSISFHEEHFKLRTPSEHQHYLQLMEDNPSLHDYYSMTYGVNRKSILDSLEYFNVADECIIPDIMHDILEGYLPYKTKLMLKHFIRWSENLLSIGTKV